MQSYLCKYYCRRSLVSFQQTSTHESQGPPSQDISIEDALYAGRENGVLMILQFKEQFRIALFLQ